MAHPQIATFARLADGNARPARAISGQNSLITRTIHEIGYNAVRDEIVVPQFYLQGIMTYRGSANGDEAPIRILAGPKTQLSNADRLGLDAVHNELFIPLDGKILVFPADGQGDIEPIRIIQGPDTQLGERPGLGVDPVNNLLVVTTPAPGVARRGDQRVGQIVMFNRTDNGNVKPKAIIRGPKTKLTGGGRVAVYPPTKYFQIGVTTASVPAPDNFVGVWHEDDRGDVPPHWTIGGPNLILRQIRGITLIPHAKHVAITDKYVNAIMTFDVPEIF